METVKTVFILDLVFDYLPLRHLKMIARLSKKSSNLLVTRKETIRKIKFLKDNKVNYNDPTNFIYTANNVKFQDFKLQRIFDLYMKFYNSSKIVIRKSYVTSIPVFPKMTHLTMITQGEIKNFPIQPNMCYLHSNNKINNLSRQPKLMYFYM